MIGAELQNGQWYLRIHIHDLGRATEATLAAIVLVKAVLYGVKALPLTAKPLHGGDAPPITHEHRAHALQEKHTGTDNASS